MDISEKAKSLLSKEQKDWGYSIALVIKGVIYDRKLVRYAWELVIFGENLTVYLLSYTDLFVIFLERIAVCMPMFIKKILYIPIEWTYGASNKVFCSKNLKSMG